MGLVDNNLERAGSLLAKHEEVLFIEKFYLSDSDFSQLNRLIKFFILVTFFPGKILLFSETKKRLSRNSY